MFNINNFAYEIAVILSQVMPLSFLNMEISIFPRTGAGIQKPNDPAIISERL